LASAVLAVAVSVGCSGARARRQELRTPVQASLFLTSVARRGGVEDWQPAPGVSAAANRVWAEREAIADLGARIRREGGEWGCELAAGSVRASSFGVFSAGDRQSLAEAAAQSGAKQTQIEAFFADELKLSLRDLRAVTVAVCPEADFGTIRPTPAKEQQIP
jgi:hypothetical protein